MIIAKAGWFKRRKYGGWGVETKTWQGEVYIAAMILSELIFIFIGVFYLKNTTITLILTGIWLAFFMIDLSDVLWKIKKDERE